MKNSEVRQNHQPINNRLFSITDLEKVTGINWFEKICLWFVKPKYKTNDIEGNTLKYKIFRGKMYVLAHWLNPPQQWNCRCQINHISHEVINKYHDFNN